jgi:Domain of Unknown Function (DUF748)
MEVVGGGRSVLAGGVYGGRVLAGAAGDQESGPQARADRTGASGDDRRGRFQFRGVLNPVAPSDNTDVNVAFKNVDMVSASPYSMKFAGYRIAEGKISLDLRYKVRNSQLQGANQIVIDARRVADPGRAAGGRCQLVLPQVAGTPGPEPPAARRCLDPAGRAARERHSRRH